MLPGIGSAQGRSWDKILRGFNCGWHCFSESFAFSYLLQQLNAAAAAAAAAVLGRGGDEPPASFQERFVGIGRFIRRPSHDQ